MKNFKQIDKCDVWPKLQDGKRVYVVIFKSVLFTEGLNDLSRVWSVHNINKLLTEEDVVFYEEIGE
jgi:hypothetical protein